MKAKNLEQPEAKEAKYKTNNCEHKHDWSKSITVGRITFFLTNYVVRNKILMASRLAS